MTAYDLLNPSHFDLGKIASSLTFPNTFKVVLRGTLDSFLVDFGDNQIHRERCV